MRTTVTLDPDVAAKLKAVARARGISFKEALNQAIRAGLRSGRRPTSSFRPYTQDMGLRPGVNLDRALAQAAVLEDHELLSLFDTRPSGPASIRPCGCSNSTV